MFDPQHLCWLLESNDDWNARRDCNDFQPLLGDRDISGALLESNRFVGLDNHRPDLRKINLSSADLSDATLDQADLTGANLSFANLDKTRLRYAKLHNANLTASEPSNALLFPLLKEGTVQGKEDYCCPMTKVDQTINSVSRLLRTIGKLKNQLYRNADVSLYFRGEACDSWT